MDFDCYVIRLRRSYHCHKSRFVPVMESIVSGIDSDIFVLSPAWLAARLEIENILGNTQQKLLFLVRFAAIFPCLTYLFQRNVEFLPDGSGYTFGGFALKIFKNFLQCCFCNTLKLA